MSSLPPYSWLLFDADGTLFDYEIAEAKALQGAFAAFHLPFSSEQAALYQKINHQIWLDFENGQITSEALRVERFQRLFDSLNLPVDPSLFSDRYLLNLSNASDLMQDAEKIIEVLRGKYQLAIITNGLKDVQRPRLANSAIANDFEAMFISEEMGIAKPDPRFFDQVFAQIGSPRKESVLVIGDSLSSDIQGGNRYGLDTCWFNPAQKPSNPQIPATYEIHRLENLLELLNSAG